MMRARKYLLIPLGAAPFLALAALMVSIATMNMDATHELRGRYEPSADGKTYLVIEDDNGGHCGVLSVDGERWPHRIHERGEVEPGIRTISCGAAIDLAIKPGNIYYFDYWGP